MLIVLCCAKFSGIHPSRLRRMAHVSTLSYLRLASFLAATLLIDLINSYLPVLMIGHCIDDPNLLASATMGNLIFNIFFLSTSYGLASGLDTLLSQQHGQDEALNTTLDTTRSKAHIFWTVISLVVVGIPTALICFFAGSVLKMLGQPSMLVGNAGKFARVLILACGLPLIVRTVQGKILATTGTPCLPLIGTLVGTVSQILMLWVVFGTDCNANANATGSGTPNDLPFFFNWLGWTDKELFLGAALGKAAYAFCSSLSVGIILVATSNPLCPMGCCVRCGPHYGKDNDYRDETINRETALLSPIVLETNILNTQNNDAPPPSPPPPPPPPPMAGFFLVLSLAVPSMLAMIGEWWSAEIRTLVAGWLPHAPNNEAASKIPPSSVALLYM